MRSYTDIAPMVVALCFLLNIKFYTAELWKDWLASAPPGKLRVFVHASKFVGEEAAKLREWIAACDAHEVPAIRTRWAHPSVLRAETILFDAASESPDVTHMGLISENGAPCLRPADLLTLCDQIAGKSLFEPWDPADTRVSYRTKKILASVGCSTLLLHNQSFLLAKEHYESIRSPLMTALDRYGSNHTTDGLSLDEILPFTLIVNLIGDECYHIAPFMFMADDGGLHALWFDDEWVSANLPRLCESAKDAVREGKIPELCAIRKVNDTPVLRRVLRSVGVLS